MPKSPSGGQGKVNDSPPGQRAASRLDPASPVAEQAEQLGARGMRVLLVGIAGVGSQVFHTAPLPFPFQPIHVTIAAWFTIGVPAFVRWLAQNNERAHTGFVWRVMTAALPSGAVIGIATFGCYLLAYRGGNATPVEQTEAPTSALITC